MKVFKCNFWNRITQNPFIQRQNKRYTTKTIQSNAQVLLDKMNKGTQYKENEAKTNFTSNILTSIKLSDNIKFTDERYFVRCLDEKGKQRNLCTLKIGKTAIMMDSESGEILNIKKSSFKSFRSVMQQAEQTMQEFIENFNDNNIVQKCFLGITGFTKKGFERLNPEKYRMGTFKGI